MPFLQSIKGLQLLTRDIGRIMGIYRTSSQDTVPLELVGTLILLEVYGFAEISTNYNMPAYESVKKTLLVQNHVRIRMRYRLSHLLRSASRTSFVN